MSPKFIAVGKGKVTVTIRGKWDSEHLKKLGHRPLIKAGEALYYGQFDVKDYLSKINFEFESEFIGTYPIQVSLDNGQSYSPLDPNSKTILLASSLTVITQPQVTEITPLVIDKVALNT